MHELAQTGLCRASINVQVASDAGIVVFTFNLAFGALLPDRSYGFSTGRILRAQKVA
jgi:hypothetical protein